MRQLKVLEEEDSDGKNGENDKKLRIAWRRKDEKVGRSMPKFLHKIARYQVVSAISSIPM